MKEINPFHNGTYDPCLTDNCQNPTQHKSGYCSSCRVRHCEICKTDYVASQNIHSRPSICGSCRAKGRKLK